MYVLRTLLQSVFSIRTSHPDSIGPSMVWRNDSAILLEVLAESLVGPSCFTWTESFVDMDSDIVSVVAASDCMSRVF